MTVGPGGAIDPVPVTPFVVGINPGALGSFNHFPGGSATAGLASYADLNAYFWFNPAPVVVTPSLVLKNWDARGNRRGARALHGLHGIEDSLTRISSGNVAPLPPLVFGTLDFSDPDQSGWIGVI